MWSLLFNRHSGKSKIYFKYFENGFCVKASRLKDQNKVKVDCINPKHIREIENHFSFSQTFLSEMKYITPKLLSRPKSPDALYLCSESIADTIVDVLKLEVNLQNTIVFEFNPGFGFITERLLKLDVQLIKALENDLYFKEKLNCFVEVFHNRLQVYNKSVLHLRNITYMDSLDEGSRLTKFMKEVQKKNWNDDPPYTIVGSLTNNNFLRYLAISIICQEGICLYGRPHLYVIIQPKLFADLSPDFNYIKSFPILCKIMFDIELLHVFNRKDFIPWPRSKKPKISIKVYNEVDYNKLYFIKMSPKRDFYDKIGGKENLRPLWLFTREISKSGKTRVIPQIEKWVPGCGYRLIRLTINVFTAFEDLSIDQILQIFIEFTKWPEFKHSSFLHAADLLSSQNIREAEFSKKPEEKMEEIFENEEDNEPDDH